jgi:hypothetical protein
MVIVGFVDFVLFKYAGSVAVSAYAVAVDKFVVIGFFSAFIAFYELAFGTEPSFLCLVTSSYAVDVIAGSPCD